MAGVAADTAKQHVQIRKVEAVELESTVPGHQRVVFVPETQGRGQFVRKPVAVSHEKSELPLLRGRLNELLAFAHTILHTEQELRPCVELVGRWPSVKRCCSTVEV